MSWLTWALAGTVGLVLVVLSVHLVRERHRYRLETPRGIIRSGMTEVEVAAALGPPRDHEHTMLVEARRWYVNGTGTTTQDQVVLWVYSKECRVWHAVVVSPGQYWSFLRRPSLVEHVRSWLIGERGDRADAQRGPRQTAARPLHAAAPAQGGSDDVP